MNMKMDKILAEISAGELIDKITILEIKKEKISNKEKLGIFYWLSLAMIPNLIGAMCAITWHIFDNQPELYGLVTLQGIFTFIGNSTLAIATIAIYKRTESYE